MLLLDYFFKRLDRKLNSFWEPYYSIENKLPEQNLLSQEVSEMRHSWHSTFKLYIHFAQRTQFTVGWLKSFIPNTQEFYFRNQLSSAINKTSVLFESANQATKIASHRLVDSTFVGNNGTTSKITNSNQVASHEKKHQKVSIFNNVWPNFFKNNSENRLKKPEYYIYIKQQNNKYVFEKKRLYK